MRRWFVDPLTSFDAGAIALAVAERRNRQPRIMPPLRSRAAAFPEEIDDAEADRLAGEIKEGIAELVPGKQNGKSQSVLDVFTWNSTGINMDPSVTHMESAEAKGRANCPTITRLCNTDKMR